METRLIDWLQRAKKEHFSLGAFNIDNLEILQAAAEAAKNLSAPIIAEVSPGEIKYLGLQNFISLANNYKDDYGITILLNMDHASDMDIIKSGIELGFDMVHFDGSELPFEENVRLTKEIVGESHSKGVLVEGEIDHFPGTSELHGELTDRGQGLEKKYTDPQKAKEFVEETGIDIFAAFIGNAHGVYQDGSEKLDCEKLTEVSRALPETFLSLHGGSGIAPEEIESAVERGIVKVNVNTELRIAFRQNLENVLKGNPDEWAVYKLMPPAIEAVRKIIERKITLFGSAGKA